MQALRDLLTARPPEHVLWQSDRHPITIADLSALSDRLAPALAGRRVAIETSDTSLAASLMVVLDGMAEALFIVPSALAEESRTAFYRDAAIDVVVTDGPRPGSEIDGIGVLSLSNGPEPSLSIHGEGIPERTKAAGIDNGPTRWILATSGTTGTPKLVSHSLASLTRSVKAQTQTPYRWGLLYDIRRFAGLQVFLQSLLSGASLILPPEGASFEARLEMLRDSGCNALSATPTMWRKLLMTPVGRAMPLQQITLGGEIADGAVLKALRATFPEARITHIYASTEAGVGFSVHDGLEGFPASYLDAPRNGIALKVDDRGHLLIQPPHRQQRYLTPGASLYTDDGWIDTNDRVERRGERFLFLGRENGAINVGGSKVYPEEVETTILELPEVAGCAVRGRRNSFTGMLVEALIVPTEASTVPGHEAALKKKVREHCRQRLEPFKVPAVVQIVAELSANPSGKLDRAS